ncbi:unnamed protein product [Lactuca saligna]|uniref:Uncharacterized protein n=1 Tax=Lactuca saligna TaxID=75948 RepID=A0AA35ZY19_LACSI|nr:unnamed protein product [Lactuca saligna]
MEHLQPLFPISLLPCTRIRSRWPGFFTGFTSLVVSFQCVEKRVDFMDVLAKKWVGSPRFHEVDLFDRVLPSFPFRNEAFIACASAIQDVERCRAAEEPSRSESIDHVSVDVGIESYGNWLSEEEFVADTSLNVALVQNEVIDILDDGNVEKVFVEENVVGPKTVILRASEHLDVRVEKSDVGKAPCLLHFGHGKNPLVGASEVRDSSGVAFSFAWSLKDDSHLSLFESAIDFAKNAFPPVAEKKMLEDSVMRLERDKLALGAAIGQLKKENEGLRIQLESFVRNLVEKDQVVEEKSMLLGGFDRDLPWVMKEGLAWVVDHVLESPKLGYGVNKFREACVVAGRALGIEEAKKLVGSALELAVDDGVNHAKIMEEALDAFASLITYRFWDLRNWM